MTVRFRGSALTRRVSVVGTNSLYCVIPAAIVDMAGIKKGDYLHFEFLGAGSFRAVKVSPEGTP